MSDANAKARSTRRCSTWPAPGQALLGQPVDVVFIAVALTVASWICKWRRKCSRAQGRARYARAHRPGSGPVNGRPKPKGWIASLPSGRGVARAWLLDVHCDEWRSARTRQYAVSTSIATLKGGRQSGRTFLASPLTAAGGSDRQDCGL